jgi:hypothetical protein
VISYRAAFTAAASVLFMILSRPRPPGGADSARRSPPAPLSAQATADAHHDARHGRLEQAPYPLIVGGGRMCSAIGDRQVLPVQTNMTR